MTRTGDQEVLPQPERTGRLSLREIGSVAFQLERAGKISGEIASTVRSTFFELAKKWGLLQEVAENEAVWIPADTVFSIYADIKRDVDEDTRRAIDEIERALRRYIAGSN